MRFVMFIGIKMSDDIPTKEGFIRNSIDLDRSKGWELVSASTIMKNEFKYSGAKFEIVQSYLHAIDILSNPSYNGSYNQNLKIVSLIFSSEMLLFIFFIIGVRILLYTNPSKFFVSFPASKSFLLCQYPLVLVRYSHWSI